MKTLLLILLSLNTFSQINVKLPPYNAKGDNIADDTWALQTAIDSAVKTFGTVYIPVGKYKISKTLVVAKLGATGYGQVCIKIIGEDLMHSPGISMIKPTFKDAPALALHINKGTIVRGIFFDGMYRSPNITLDSVYRSDMDTYGDTSCRDSRYSPYCAIAIDPFRATLPPDSGYPTLRTWYTGLNTVSGSTGIRIEDCTFKNFTIGLIVSPNGYTLNAEILTFENIRVNDCKHAFVGCQAQEKQNRLINWEVWGRVRCVFVWGKYGAAQPGHYNISGVNIAGQIVQMVYRPSQGFFPLYIDNVFAENLGSIGYWNTSVGDVLSNSTINFYWFRYIKAFPNNHLNGTGLSLYNVNVRYYGQPLVPVLFKGINIAHTNTQANNYANHIKGLRYIATDPDYQNGFEIKRVSMSTIPTYYEAGIKKARLMQTYDSVHVGDMMVFYQASNLDYSGMGEVESVGIHGDYVVSYISPSITNNFLYNVGRYISK